MKKLLILTIPLMYINCCVSGQDFYSKNFSIQKLTDGVYAAVSKNGGYAICNAGIIDLGDATLIFDPFMTPEAAEDLKKISEILTGHKVKYVVNSHFHNDHIGGDQVFTNAEIISTQRTRELIAKYQPEEIADDKIGAPAQLAKYKNKTTSGMTPHELEENIMWKGYYEALVTSGKSLKLVLPDITFNDQFVLYGKKRNVSLFCYGEGHTESDLFLYLPSEKIAFLGDLLFIQNQPWLGDGDPVKWRSYLDSISKLSIKIFVPGHGPVGISSSLDTMKLYFETVQNTAMDYFKRGQLPEKDSTLKSPSLFDSWFLSNFYKPNVISDYKRLYRK